MLSRTNYEQELIQELKGLSRSDMARVVKMVHFLKEEILDKKAKHDKQEILSFAGMLKNLTDEESELFEEAAKRKPLFRYLKARKALSQCKGLLSDDIIQLREERI